MATLYTVSFTSTGGVETVSRHFSTVRAARKWATWLASRSYVTRAKVFRGEAGGELVAAL